MKTHRKADRKFQFVARFMFALLACILAGTIHPVRATAQDGVGNKLVDSRQKSANADLIARGKYLVEGVAGCGDCHTPRNEDGKLDRTRWLEGAPVFLRPAKPEPGWAIVAPRLAGSPPASDAEIITLLTTGHWRDGKSLRPPMPHFQMTSSDAEAILLYLKSLNPTAIP